jgi:hypothetical protein
MAQGEPYWLGQGRHLVDPHSASHAYAAGGAPYLRSASIAGWDSAGDVASNRRYGAPETRRTDALFRDRTLPADGLPTRRSGTGAIGCSGAVLASAPTLHPQGCARLACVGASDLERVREIAFALQEVSERLSHGAACFFVREKRPVCYFHDHRTGNAR